MTWKQLKNKATETILYYFNTFPPAFKLLSIVIILMLVNVS